jgi:hypothetical protein
MPLLPALRIATYVIEEHRAAVAAAIHAAMPVAPGARYDRVCWWSAAWIEQFRPLPGAVPAVGRVGEESRLPTVRLEVVLPPDDALAERVCAAIRAAHPWEVPVIVVEAIRVPADGYAPRA